MRPSGLLLTRRTRWFHTNKNLIPLGMVGRNCSIPRERSLQYFDVSHLRNIEPTPSRPLTAALSADLPRKQSGTAFLNAVVVRFNDSLLVLVHETNPFFPDCALHQRMQSRIHRHFDSTPF